MRPLALASLLAPALARQPYVYESHSLYKRDGGSHHHAPAPASYAAPSPSYPAPSYTAPAPSYGAPAPSYSEPAPAYGAPEPSYSAPAPYDAYASPDTGYGSPQPSYATGGLEVKGIDLTSILIPLLALLGLSLLFPTYVNLTSVKRRKRSLNGGKMEPKLTHRHLSDIHRQTHRTQHALH